MRGLPDEGKIVVLAPEVAARAAELHPDLAERIYTVHGLVDQHTAYVLDLDAIRLLPETERDTT